MSTFMRLLSTDLTYSSSPWNRRELWLNDNELTGMLPVQLGSCLALADLHLENNVGIIGKVPESLGNLENLGEFF